MAKAIVAVRHEFAEDHREVRQFMLAGDEGPKHRLADYTSGAARSDVEPLTFPKDRELRTITHPRR